MTPAILEFLKVEHQTARAELLWRLNGIYDVQKTALPLLIALMVALSYAGAEHGAFQRLPLIVGWMLVPSLFALVITKMKHHRQRNKELGLYIKFIEMIIYQRFPHTVVVNGNSVPGLRVCIARKGTQQEYVDFF
jgi:hypothetical protein